MSAYIVEKKTIDRIVTYIVQQINPGVVEAYYPTLFTETRNPLGQKLYLPAYKREA